VAQAHGFCLSLEKWDRMRKKDRRWGSQCDQFRDLDSGLMSLVERQRTVLASRPQRRRELHVVTGLRFMISLPVPRSRAADSPRCAHRITRGLADLTLGAVDWKSWIIITFSMMPTAH
jgi:hypothetical protein